MLERTMVDASAGPLAAWTDNARADWMAVRSDAKKAETTGARWAVRSAVRLVDY